MLYIRNIFLSITFHNISCINFFIDNFRKHIRKNRKDASYLVYRKIFPHFLQKFIVLLEYYTHKLSVLILL
jgi:ribosomal protein S15P/S13E